MHNLGMSNDVGGSLWCIVCFCSQMMRWSKFADGFCSINYKYVRGMLVLCPRNSVQLSQQRHLWLEPVDDQADGFN